jgi:hypothetical protein
LLLPLLLGLPLGGGSRAWVLLVLQLLPLPLLVALLMLSPLSASGCNKPPSLLLLPGLSWP